MLLGDAVSTAQAFVQVLYWVYLLCILAYILTSWVPLPYNVWLNRVQRFLYDVVDPYLRLFRRHPAAALGCGSRARPLTDRRHHRAVDCLWGGRHRPSGCRLEGRRLLVAKLGDRYVLDPCRNPARRPGPAAAGLRPHRHRRAPCRRGRELRARVARARRPARRARGARERARPAQGARAGASQHAALGRADGRRHARAGAPRGRCDRGGGPLGRARHRQRRGDREGADPHRDPPPAGGRDRRPRRLSSLPARRARPPRERQPRNAGPPTRLPEFGRRPPRYTQPVARGMAHA